MRLPRVVPTVASALMVLSAIPGPVAASPVAGDEPEVTVVDPDAVTWTGGQVRGPRTIPVRW